MDLEALRRLFPVTETTVFLNNAAESPLCVPVRARLEAYLDLAQREPHRKPNPRPAVRAALARLLGGEASDYALVTSTGVGIGLVAAGHPWAPGDNVVVPAEEHWNNTFPWLALREQGVEVRLVEPDAQRRVTPEAVAARMDARTRILAVAAVRFDTGFRADLQALSALARAQDALFLVDGIQAAGAVPLDVLGDGIDILACAGFKWLLGLPGTGCLYLNARARERVRPVLPGMFSGEDHPRELHYFPDARRFETGTLAYGPFHAWTAGLELLQDLGVDTIHARVLGLTDRLLVGLKALGVQVISPVARPEERSAILAFTLGDSAQDARLKAHLGDRGIQVALRGGRIRVSPNVYNSEAEVDRFLEETGDFRRSTG